MRRFKSPGHLQRILAAHNPIAAQRQSSTECVAA